MRWLIKRLGLQQKLVVYILNLNQALPLRDIISVSDEGETLIAGRTLDIEKAVVLREAATIALNNPALNLIREQVVYETFIGAATKAASREDLTFYRAALWYGQQMERHLKILAQRQEQPEL